MDVHQWMDKSIKGIEAIAPANVDWLFWSMTKSEWAAWVQAIFSLVGIAVAILVPAIQRCAERKRLREDALDAAELAGHQVQSYIQMINPGMHALYKRALKDLNGSHSHGFIELYLENMAAAIKPSELQLSKLLPIVGNPAYKIATAYGWMERMYSILSFHTRNPLDLSTAKVIVKNSLSELLVHAKLMDEANEEIQIFLTSRKIMAKKKMQKSFAPPSMTCSQALVGSAVFVSFFVFWFLIETISFDFLNWVGGKQNLSGWVQAIGVIVALFITIRVADLPRKQATVSSVMQAKAFAIILYKYTRYIRQICPGKHVDSFYYFASIIRDLMSVNTGLNYGNLPRNIVSHCYEFRSTGVFIEEINSYLKNNKSITPSDRQAVFENLYSILDKNSVLLDNSLKTILRESNSIVEENEDFDEIVKSIDKGLADAIAQSEAHIPDSAQS